MVWVMGDDFISAVRKFKVEIVKCEEGYMLKVLSYYLFVNESDAKNVAPDEYLIKSVVFESVEVAKKAMKILLKILAEFIYDPDINYILLEDVERCFIEVLTDNGVIDGRRKSIST